MFATTRNIWALEKAGKDVNHEEEIIDNTVESLFYSLLSYVLQKMKLLYCNELTGHISFF
jgi:hypothetical protein